MPPFTLSSDQLLHVMRVTREQNLTATLVHALCLLRESEADHITLSSVARQLGISTAAITAVADRLEQIGYASRVDGNDRRKIWLQVTPKGIAALHDIQSNLQESIKS